MSRLPMFRGSSQATTGGNQERVRTKSLKELKDRVQALQIWGLFQGQGLNLITFIDGMIGKEMIREMRIWRLNINWLITNQLCIQSRRDNKKVYTGCLCLCFCTYT